MQKMESKSKQSSIDEDSLSVKHNMENFKLISKFTHSPEANIPPASIFPERFKDKSFKKMKIQETPLINKETLNIREIEASVAKE
jgi:hypothetical protein